MIIKRKNPCVPMVYYDKNTNMSDLTNLFVLFQVLFLHGDIGPSI